jgi:hypothetical protein
MSHLGSYWWIRKTQVIPEYVVFYNVCGILLGQSSVTATSAYLGVSDNSALELARSINV